jgi:hypothetical protein
MEKRRSLMSKSERRVRTGVMGKKKVERWDDRISRDYRLLVPQA